MAQRQAILIMGPTGSGKTPLGAYIEQQGLFDKRCAHFDFGEELRTLAQCSTPPPRFTAQDIDFVKKVLSSGALLERETFYIAQNIVATFIEIRNVVEKDIIVLNGLPRHTGQAADIAERVNCKAVIHLDCTSNVLLERIALNSGGDRTFRTDDTLNLIEKKINLFNERTAPLRAYYQERNVVCLSLPVDVDTAPKDLYGAIINHGALKKQFT